MRTHTYEIPPQEVMITNINHGWNNNDLFRFWPRTQWLCLSMGSCTTRWRMPSTPWPMWTTLVALPVCLRPPPWGMIVTNPRRDADNTGLSLADTDHVILTLGSDWSANSQRNVLGTMTLGEILSHRENIAREMKVRENICILIVQSCWYKRYIPMYVVKTLEVAWCKHR